MNYLIEDMSKVLKYLPVATLVALLVVLVYLLICIIRKKEFSIWNLILYGLDIIYFLVMFEIALFSRIEGTVAEIDFTLFGKYTDDLRGRMYIYENILMTIPMGILLPLTFCKRFKFFDVLISAFMVSITIELIQLAFQCGFCQLSDVIMNVLGGVIGYVIYKIFYFIGRKV